MNLIGMRFDDIGGRGHPNIYLIVRRELSDGYYEVEWFCEQGYSSGTNPRWRYEDLMEGGGSVRLNETDLMKRILESYES